MHGLPINAHQEDFIWVAHIGLHVLPINAHKSCINMGAVHIDLYGLIINVY